MVEVEVSTVEEIMRQFGENGVETHFRVGKKTYQVFAYQSPGPPGPNIRWKLYELADDGSGSLRGLTFGVAEGVREALEEVVRSAQEHARFGLPPRPQRTLLSFRPGPQD